MLSKKPVRKLTFFVTYVKQKWPIDYFYSFDSLGHRSIEYSMTSILGKIASTFRSIIGHYFTIRCSVG